MGLPKGRTNNPYGRKKEADSFSSAMKDMKDKVVELVEVNNPNKLTYVQMFSKIVWEKVIIEKDPMFCKLAANYLDGMPQQYVEHTGSIENPLLKTLEETEGSNADNVSVSTDVVDDVKPNE